MSYVLPYIKKTPAVLFFLILFGFYLHRAAPPAIVSFDGDLPLAVSLLGVPASPGAPAFLLLSRVIVLLSPWGGELGLANLLLFPLALLLCLALIRILAGRLGLSASLLPALLVVAVGAFEPRLGVLALAPGGGALAALLLMLAALVLLRGNAASPAKSTLRDRCLALYLAVLSLAASPYGFVFLPLFFLMFIRRVKHQVLAFCVLLLGLMPFLYLPLRAAADPLLNWGRPAGLRALVVYLWPVGYLDFNDPGMAVRALAEYCLPLGCLGLLGVLCLRRPKQVFAGLAVILSVLFLSLPFFDNFSDRQYMEEGGAFALGFVLLIGCGLLLGRFHSYARQQRRRQVIFWVVAVLVLLMSLSRARGFPDYSGASYGYDHARGVLALLPPGADVFLQDPLFAQPVFSLQAWHRVGKVNLYHVWPEFYGGGGEMRRLRNERYLEDSRHYFHNARLTASSWVFYEARCSYLVSMGVAGWRWGFLELVRGDPEIMPPVMPPRFLTDESRWINWPTRYLVAAYAQTMVELATDEQTKEDYLALAVRAAGDTPLTLYWLGRYHMSRGELEQAIRYFVRLTELEPQAVRAYTSLALCYEAQPASGNMAGVEIDWANVYFFKALGVNPRDRELLVARGSYFLRRGQIKKSLVFFETALKLWGTAPDLIRWLGLGYGALEGQEEKALVYLGEYVSLQPPPRDAAEIKAVIIGLEESRGD